jgi:hypothetical protein
VRRRDGDADRARTRLEMSPGVDGPRGEPRVEAGAVEDVGLGLVPRDLKGDPRRRVERGSSHRPLQPCGLKTELLDRANGQLARAVRRAPHFRVLLDH